MPAGGGGGGHTAVHSLQDRGQGSQSCQTHLLKGHTAGQEFDQVPGLENQEWVPGLPRCTHRHAPLDEVQLAGNPLHPGEDKAIVSTTNPVSLPPHVLLEASSDVRPHLLQVLLSVAGE